MFLNFLFYLRIRLAIYPIFSINDKIFTSEQLLKNISGVKFITKKTAWDLFPNKQDFKQILIFATK
jgi:hypothetical protein